LIEHIFYPPCLKFYRVWGKSGRTAHPLIEVEQAADGWAVYLLGKRGHRRFYRTLDKEEARELLQRHHANGDTVELLEK